MSIKVGCQCYKGGDCYVCTGEAVWVVERAGERLYLCSRCNLSGDKKVARLYSEEDVPRLAALDEGKIDAAKRDPIGALCDTMIGAFGGFSLALEAGLELPLEHVA